MNCNHEMFEEIIGDNYHQKVFTCGLNINPTARDRKQSQHIVNEILTELMLDPRSP